MPGLALDDSQQSQLLRYLQLLQKWNRTYNLTAVRDAPEMVTRHLLDSLSVLPWLGQAGVLDAGTGAGLPGIPLAIARPRQFFWLLDSAGKKIRFLNHVQRELGLDNVQPVQDRLEHYQPEPSCKTVISRAFSSLTSFAAALRAVDSERRLLAMKGRRPDEELERLPSWVRVEAVEKLFVPGLKEDRHLVIMCLNS